MTAAKAYLFWLAAMAVWGGLAAYGQEPVPLEVAMSTPVGPMTFDLGNLTLPGAIVIVAWMFRNGIPFTFKHIHYNSGGAFPDEPTGGHRAP